MSTNIPANNKGFNFNYYTKLTFSNTTYNATADYVILKQFQILSLINEGSNQIFVSFNGNSDDTDLIPASSTATLQITNQGNNKIWVRSAGGSCTLRIETDTIATGSGSSGGGGSATSALQTTGNTSLASIDSKTPSKGSATMANSEPVTIASDDTLTTAIKNNTAPATSVTGVSVALSNVKTQLASHATIHGIMICNPVSTGITIFVFDTNSTSSVGIEIVSGDREFFPVSNSNLLFVTAASGTPSINYLVM